MEVSDFIVPAIYLVFFLVVVSFNFLKWDNASKRGSGSKSYADHPPLDWLLLVTLALVGVYVDITGTWLLEDWQRTRWWFLLLLCSQCLYEASEGPFLYEDLRRPTGDKRKLRWDRYAYAPFCVLAVVLLIVGSLESQTITYQVSFSLLGILLGITWLGIVGVVLRHGCMHMNGERANKLLLLSSATAGTLMWLFVLVLPRTVSGHLFAILLLCRIGLRCQSI
jgi:hypothetical protein